MRRTIQVTSLIIRMLACCLLLALPACSGPTKAGLEARAAARQRIGLVNAQINYDQAERAFEVGQFERAAEEIGAAIRQSPDQPSFHLLKGRILLEQHRLQDAMRAFERAIEVDTGGNLAEPHYFTGIVWQRWSNFEAAHDAYMKAAEIDPSNAHYLLASAESLIARERYEQAGELIQTRLAYFEHHSALRHLLGQIAMLQDEPKRAAKLLHEAHLLNPDDDMLLEELARAQFEAGMYSRCHESIRKLHRGRGERRADVVHLEARCLVMMERPAEARALYLELTELVPGDVQAWIELGSIAYTVGDHRRLGTSGARVVALAPDRWEGYFLQAMYERALGQGDPQSAAREARLLTQAADRASAPGASLPHLMLGRTMEAIGNTKAALAAYDRALRLDPRSREAREMFSRLEESEHLTSVPVE